MASCKKYFEVNNSNPALAIISPRPDPKNSLRLHCHSDARRQSRVPGLGFFHICASRFPRWSLLFWRIVAPSALPFCWTPTRKPGFTEETLHLPIKQRKRHIISDEKKSMGISYRDLFQLFDRQRLYSVNGRLNVERATSCHGKLSDHGFIKNSMHGIRNFDNKTEKSHDRERKQNN